MDDYIKIQHDAFPSCSLPGNLDSVVWRYMDFDKFKYLVEKKALYLCRADRLQDRFEGTFAREQIVDMNQWLENKRYNSVIEDEENYRKQIRKQTYISCWCLRTSDLDLMWKAYIRKSPGIAIKSTVRHLQRLRDESIDYWPLDLSKVTYFDHAGGQHIDYDRLSHFHYKDWHFKLDNEIRLLHWPNYILPSPEHVDLPIRPEELIISVVLEPQTSEENLKVVKKLMDTNGLRNIPIEYSRDDRYLHE